MSLQLSYANEQDPRLKRWLIRSVEGLSGRARFCRLYEDWRSQVVPSGQAVFGRMLAMLDIGLRETGEWPPRELPATPLVIVANHPFGIGDGIAVLALAERLGRPFRVLINAELLKIPEMAPYALPIDFSETKAAVANNLAVRQQALALLAQGVTVVVFPAGGVATAPKGFGAAHDLPWKLFTARLVREAKASVLPIYFSGQNGRLFHLVSGAMDLTDDPRWLHRHVGRLSLTLRLSLLVREFAKLSGRTISVRVGPVLTWSELQPLSDRKALLERVRRAVTELGDARPARGLPRLGARLRRQAAY